MFTEKEVTPSGEVALEELDDNELLDLTRQENAGAYAVLYDRYVYSARRLARHLGQREEADDVVSESFAQVLDLLQRGKGPDRAFRAYLFTTIRHESGRRAKANKRVMPTDDESQIDATVSFGGGQLDEFESSAIRAAYESLPERWRTVLWHLDVEGLKPNEIAPLLDMKPNSVSALVYRARSALRDAYLQQHVNHGDEPRARTCREVRRGLAAVVRRTAGNREQEKVHSHLQSCEDCMAVYLDLHEVNRDVGSIVSPVALAAAVAGGGMLVAAHAGSAVLAHLVVAAKGALVAASVPAAAVALTVGTAGWASTHVDTPRSANYENSSSVATDRALTSASRPVVQDERRSERPAPDPASSLPTKDVPTRAKPTTSASGQTPLPSIPSVDLGEGDVSIDAEGVTAGPLAITPQSVKDGLDRLGSSLTK
ncbi:sigma-70 family RNA polymerase sigma factor [Aeromicrobium sp.]|uniref:sigma-70 family RNA polymerase sigma factor n=1 Tax=Aeromicrobium sp. TaxID=1871063 RepID=UPI0030BAA136